MTSRYIHRRFDMSDTPFQQWPFLDTPNGSISEK